MKYLTTPEASLVTMWVVARHLEHFGPATEAELMSRLRPPQMTEGEGFALKGSVKVGEDLGLFDLGAQAKPKYRNCLALSEGRDWFDSFDGFTSVARRLLLLQTSAQVENCSDVATGVSWLISRDWRRPQRPLSHEDNAPDGAISTVSQATAFARWIAELGFGSETSGNGSAIMSDPTPAMRQDLAGLPKGRYSARRVVDHFSQTIPLGPRQVSILASHSGTDPAGELEVFSAVGYAIQRLKEEGLIRTKKADDAPERIIYRFPGPADIYEEITHIEVV